LAKPLTSKGRLFFARPGLMLRRVESPARSEVVITPQALKLRDENGEQKLDLAARPDVRPFVESLAWLLAGDHKALATVYRIEFVASREREPWRLTLTPKAMPLSHLIAAIEVLGTGYAVSEIHVRERSGDETITRITQANPARRFTPAELSSLFGVSTAQGKR
jgi:outer membrane lipoprotein-sorting protein